MREITLPAAAPRSTSGPGPDHERPRSGPRQAHDRPTSDPGATPERPRQRLWSPAYHRPVTTTARWIDPEVAELMASSPPLRFELTAERLPDIRRERRAAYGAAELSSDVERTDHTVPGPPGDPDVVVRVHRPVGLDGPAPCLYSVHGGGFVIGSYEMEDLRFDRWCTALGCVGVAVEYRLAPETPYPGPLEDCYAGLRWVHEHAGELGVDRTRVGIGGASAGGGLAAGLAIAARDRGELPVAFQLLVYPMLDDRQTTRSSQWEGVPIWQPVNNEFGWRAYLGDLYGGDDVPPTAAPARASDLSGLPPAFVSVGTADIFCDEDVAYAQALYHAAVPTELHVYPGAPHGFDGMIPAAGVSARARRDALDWLGRMMRG
jgi:acetyl esterase/lipase